MSRKRIIIFVIGIIIFLICAWFLISLSIAFSRISEVKSQLSSATHLKSIHHAVYSYAADHNDKLPLNFEALIPEYLYPADIFYPPLNSNFSNHYPQDEIIRTEFVDSLTPYRLLHPPGARWAIIHETPNLWSNDQIAWATVELSEDNQWQPTVWPRRGSLQEFETFLKSKLKTAKEHSNDTN